MERAPTSNEVGDRQAIEILRNHKVLLDRTQSRAIDLLSIPGVADLSLGYRTSLRGMAEAIGTLELCLKKGDVFAPIYHLRMHEYTINEVPSLVIYAIQRYTDESFATVEKPLRHNNMVSERNPILKVHSPQRYKEYQAETKIIETIEKTIEAPLPLLMVASACALAKSQGERQVVMIPYEKQMYVAWHEHDTTLVPNVIDPAAQQLGFVKSTELGSMWLLRGEADDRAITLSRETMKKLSPAVLAASQSVFDGFNQR